MASDFPGRPTEQQDDGKDGQDEGRSADEGHEHGACGLHIPYQVKIAHNAYNGLRDEL
jgi:hypothetical protein